MNAGFMWAEHCKEATKGACLVYCRFKSSMALWEPDVVVWV